MTTHVATRAFHHSLGGHFAMRGLRTLDLCIHVLANRATDPGVLTDAQRDSMNDHDPLQTHPQQEHTRRNRFVLKDKYSKMTFAPLWLVKICRGTFVGFIISYYLQETFAHGALGQTSYCIFKVPMMHGLI